MLWQHSHALRFCGRGVFGRNHVLKLLLTDCPLLLRHFAMDDLVFRRPALRVDADASHPVLRRNRIPSRLVVHWVFWSEHFHMRQTAQLDTELVRGLVVGNRCFRSLIRVLFSWHARESSLRGSSIRDGHLFRGSRRLTAQNIHLNLFKLIVSLFRHIPGRVFTWR